MVDICWTYIHKNISGSIVFVTVDTIGGNEYMWRGNQWLFPQFFFLMGLN